MDAHRWKQCVLATAAVVLLTAPVFAQRSVVHTMSAFQVKNETASSQDGFKLTLLGVDPADVIEVGGGTFMQVAGSPGTTVIDWTVSSTAVGATANFAYALAGDVNPTGTTLQWTASGTPTTLSTNLTQTWRRDGNQNVDVINNWGTTSVYVDRKVTVVDDDELEDALALAKLISTLPPYTGWPVSPWEPYPPIQIPDPGEPQAVGSQLEYTFTGVSSAVYSADVMMYDVRVGSDTGPVSVSYSNAIVTEIPEPGGMLLAGLALIVTLGSRRRR